MIIISILIPVFFIGIGIVLTISIQDYFKIKLLEEKK